METTLSAHGVDLIYLPCLLDRLTDAAPERRLESVQEKMVAPAAFKRSVEADFRRLLWTTPTLDEELRGYPAAASSALNFGVPNLMGQSVTDDERRLEIADDLHRRLLAFEPRIIPESLEVLVVRKDKLNPEVFECEIRGRIWMVPYAEEFLIRTHVDAGSGRITVGDRVFDVS